MTREILHNPILTLDSEYANMVMNMVRPYPTTIFVEGRLTLDFTFDELMRIRSWTFQIRNHRELIMKSMLGVQEPNFLDQLSKNLTRCGVTNNTLNFLRLCVILEPMQELMSRQKAYSLNPRDCLKTTLFQKWQKLLSPQGQAAKPAPENIRQPSKRRKRKGSSTNSDGGGGGAGGRTSKRKQSPVPVQVQNIAQTSGDVMIVGEPTLMGGDFGDEDERLITRLENTQYDAAAVAAAAAAAAAAAQQQPHQPGMPPGMCAGPPPPGSGVPGPPGSVGNPLTHQHMSQQASPFMSGAGGMPGPGFRGAPNNHCYAPPPPMQQQQLPPHLQQQPPPMMAPPGSGSYGGGPLGPAGQGLPPPGMAPHHQQPGPSHGGPSPHHHPHPQHMMSPCK
ncbi:unnamed protein product [Protopolystoma xenopodis]|uniref:LIM interaction domain-containing protein n=1 Tax=Protopolystoma xenopodis TaxID=117903 RepID=A0A3S5AKA3_9PLAT|nr:unnamed protein product [Protopolystoma xenopodis]